MVRPWRRRPHWSRQGRRPWRRRSRLKRVAGASGGSPFVQDGRQAFVGQFLGHAAQATGTNVVVEGIGCGGRSLLEPAELLQGFVSAGGGVLGQCRDKAGERVGGGGLHLEPRGVHARVRQRVVGGAGRVAEGGQPQAQRRKVAAAAAGKALEAAVATPEDESAGSGGGGCTRAITCRTQTAAAAWNGRAAPTVATSGAAPQAECVSCGDNTVCHERLKVLAPQRQLRPPGHQLAVRAGGVRHRAAWQNGQQKRQPQHEQPVERLQHKSRCCVQPRPCLARALPGVAQAPQGFGGDAARAALSRGVDFEPKGVERERASVAAQALRLLGPQKDGTACEAVAAVFTQVSFELLLERGRVAHGLLDQ